MRNLLAAAAIWPFQMMPAAFASHHVIDSDYPGSWAIADGHGQVIVSVQYLAAESCWRIKGVREGVPDAAADLPTGRHLYVTVDVKKDGSACQTVNTPLDAKINIPDKPGKISLDVFIVDDRGVIQRSQRHRIERECGASSSAEC